MFVTQKSGNKTSSGEICLDIGAHASPKVGQDQVSGGVGILSLGRRHDVSAEVSFAASATSWYLCNDMQNFTLNILYMYIICIAHWL